VINPTDKAPPIDLPDYGELSAKAERSLNVIGWMLLSYVVGMLTVVLIVRFA
jgi:hypothetical protein